MLKQIDIEKKRKKKDKNEQAPKLKISKQVHRIPNLEN